MPVSRLTSFRPTPPARATNIATLAGSSTASNASVPRDAAGNVTLGYAGYALADARTYQGRGYAVAESEQTPATPPGQVRFPAQTVSVTCPTTSSPSSALTLSAGSVALHVSLWASAPDFSDRTLIGSGTGPTTDTRGLLGGGTPTADVVCSELVFPFGWVLYAQIGGFCTSPQPLVGSSTETYVFELPNTTIVLATPMSIVYTRDPVEAPAVPSDVASRVTSLTRIPVEPVDITEQAIRIVHATRVAFDAGVELDDLAVRSVNFPRQQYESIEPPVEFAIRQVTFRRPTQAPIEVPADEATRTTSVTRSSLADMDIAEVAERLVTYGRVARHQFVPGDQPLIDPTKSISGVVRDRDGTPVEGAAVVLFLSGGTPVQSTTSAVDGSYSFPRNSYDASTYFVGAWHQESGPLPVQSVTERDLVPS